jgi:hypothetical protein
MTTYQKLAAVIATLLAISVTALLPARRAIGWSCIESVQSVERITHIRSFSLDRLDPTCPQCM